MEAVDWDEVDAEQVGWEQVGWEQVGWEQVDDEELAELALAADPDAPLPDDAVPLVLPGTEDGPLPLWYLPPTAAPASSAGWRRRVVVGTVVLAFVGIDAVGLCSTYGVVAFG